MLLGSATKHCNVKTVLQPFETIQGGGGGGALHMKGVGMLIVNFEVNP